MSTLAAIDNAIFESLRDSDFIAVLEPTPQVEMKDLDVDIRQSVEDAARLPGVPNIYVQPMPDGPSTAFYGAGSRSAKRTLRHRISLVHPGSLISARPIEQALVAALVMLCSSGDMPAGENIYDVDAGPWHVEKMNFGGFEANAILDGGVTLLSTVFTTEVVAPHTDLIGGDGASPRLLSAEWLTNLNVIRLTYSKSILAQPIQNIRDRACMTREDGQTPTTLMLMHATTSEVVLLYADDFVDDEEENECQPWSPGGTQSPMLIVPDNVNELIFVSKEGVAAANINVQMTIVE